MVVTGGAGEGDLDCPTFPVLATASLAKRLNSPRGFRQELPGNVVRRPVPSTRRPLERVSLTEVRRRLREGLRVPATEVERPAQTAAVLALFGNVNSEPGVLLTRRTTSLRVHSGEVSFPGGSRERGESAVKTALREAEEEVGLAPERVEILGVGPLGFTHSSGGRFVTVVGFVEQLSGFAANPDEVDAVLTVPLSRLSHPNYSLTELWYRPEFGWRDMQFYDLGEDLCWGATAAAMAKLLDLL